MVPSSLNQLIELDTTDSKFENNSGNILFRLYAALEEKLFVAIIETTMISEGRWDDLTGYPRLNLCLLDRAK